MMLNDDVIIERASSEYIRTAETKDSLCRCVDPLLGHGNPDCLICRGTGVVLTDSSSVVSVSGESHLTKGKMIFENSLTIWEDGDPISDVIVYFRKAENVKVNDVVVHKGKRYKVVFIENVTDLDNVESLFCSLDRIK